MHILQEWRINDIESKAERAASRLYELDTLRSDVANLERANGELRSEVDGLRHEIQAAQIEIAEMREAIRALGDE